MTLSKLRVVLEASVGGFNRAMRSSGRVMGNMLKSVTMLKAGVALLGTAFAAFMAILAVRRLAVVAKNIFDIGAAVAETRDKFVTTFGAASASVDEFIDTFAVMAGVSREAAQDVVSTTGAIMQGMGLAQQAAADLSVQALKLAGDLASYNNLGTEEVLLKINAALTGERESMRRLAIVFNEAEVKQRALNIATEQGMDATSNAVRVMASMQLMNEKAIVQMDNLVNTQNSAANRAKQLGAAWINLRNTVATLLQPAFLTLMETMANSELSFENLEMAVRENSATIVGWVAGTLEGMKIFSQAVVDGVRIAIRSMGLMVQAFASPTAAMVGIVSLVGEMAVAWENLGDVQGRVLGKFNEAVDLFNRAAGAGKAAVGGLTFVIGETIEEVSALNTELTRMATDFSDRIGDATQEGKAAFDDFFNSVIRGLSRLAAKMVIFKGLEFLFPNSSFVQAFGASSGLSSGASGGGGDTGSTLSGSETGFTGPLPASSASPSGNFVQHVNFNVSAIDAPAVAAMLEQQKGSIVAIVAEAAQGSSALRRTMRGG